MAVSTSYVNVLQKNILMIVNNENQFRPFAFESSFIVTPRIYNLDPDNSRFLFIILLT